MIASVLARPFLTPFLILGVFSFSPPVPKMVQNLWLPWGEDREHPGSTAGVDLEGHSFGNQAPALFCTEGSVKWSPLLNPGHHLSLLN